MRYSYSAIRTIHPCRTASTTRSCPFHQHLCRAQSHRHLYIGAYVTKKAIYGIIGIMVYIHNDFLQNNNTKQPKGGLSLETTSGSSQHAAPPLIKKQSRGRRARGERFCIIFAFGFLVFAFLIFFFSLILSLHKIIKNNNDCLRHVLFL